MRYFNIKGTVECSEHCLISSIAKLYSNYDVVIINTACMAMQTELADSYVASAYRGQLCPKSKQ